MKTMTTTYAWVLSHSFSASSTRVCQPSPVARKRSTTSRDRRMVMRSLIGSFCEPRLRKEESFSRNSCGRAEKGTARAKSSHEQRS